MARGGGLDSLDSPREIIGFQCSQDLLVLLQGLFGETASASVHDEPVVRSTIEEIAEELKRLWKSGGLAYIWRWNCSSMVAARAVSLRVRCFLTEGRTEW